MRGSMAVRVDVVTPDIAEDDDPIIVGYWFVRRGQAVFAGDELVEIVCGKTVFTVSSPVGGTVTSILADDQDVVRAGQCLAVIEG